MYSNQYDPNQYDPSHSSSQYNPNQYAPLPHHPQTAVSPPPLQHPRPQHPIQPERFHAATPQPPPQQIHSRAQGKYSPQQQQQQQQQSQFGLEQFGFNDASAQLGIQFAGTAMRQGQQALEQNLNRWINISALKHYFKVSNLYVVTKIRLLLFPWRHKTWSRLVKRNDHTSVIEGYQPPRDDINSPDMYIPVMSFVSYILLVGISLGQQEKFHPEVLGLTASTATAFIIFEFCFIKLGCYLLSIQSETAVLDLVAYSGYKFLPLCVSMVVSLIYPKIRSTFYWGLFIYLAMATGFFLLRSLRYVVLPPDEGTKTVRKRRIYFLFVIAAMQAILMFLLIR